MRIISALILIIIVIFGGIFYFNKSQPVISPVGKQPVTKPLDKYTIDSLKNRKYPPVEIKFEKIIKDNIWLFSYYSDGLKVTGAANLPTGVTPKTAFTKPVIIMIHGNVDEKTYYSGFGTEKVAAFFAKNGYVTMAPDLLGYGGSDKPSYDIFEERFQAYPTVLNLISSISNFGFRDSNLYMWAHSNGGQIALNVLAISGKSIPTILWNPVTKYFPYSILYFTDQFDDKGKALRKYLSEFEKNYDPEKYDFNNYLNYINAPILLQQGGADNQVPKAWSDEFSKKIKLTYKIYPGADHNLIPSWNQAIEEALHYLENISVPRE